MTLRRSALALLVGAASAQGCGSGTTPSAEPTAARSLHMDVAVKAEFERPTPGPITFTMTGWIGKADVAGRVRYNLKSLWRQPFRYHEKLLAIRLHTKSRSPEGRWDYSMGPGQINWVCVLMEHTRPANLSLLPLEGLASGTVPSSELIRRFNGVLAYGGIRIGRADGDAPGRISVTEINGLPASITADFRGRLLYPGLTTRQSPSTLAQQIHFMLRLSGWNEPFEVTRPPDPRDPGILDEVNSPGPATRQCLEPGSASPGTN